MPKSARAGSPVPRANDDRPPIPLLNLRAEFEEQRDRILEAIIEVLERMELYLGPQTRALEVEFAQLQGVRHAVAVGSGTEAIWLACYALGLGAGDEVIVPSHTFIATVAPLAFLGARPVFVDIEPRTYNLDPNRVRLAITPRTRAIMPVHLYGQPAEMAPLLEIARERGLLVIEDCAQAVGATYDGAPVGSLGNAGAFSFVFTKNLKAYGDAGMITTNDDALAAVMRSVRDHGRADKYTHPIFGLNLRMDEIQAAIVRVQLGLHERRTEQRRANARQLSLALRDSHVQTPVEAPGRRHVYHQYVIRTPHRDALAAWLMERRVSTGIHYPTPCHLQEACAEYGNGVGSLPETESAAREVLSLPVYPELSRTDLSRISEAVLSFSLASVDRCRN